MEKYGREHRGPRDEWEIDAVGLDTESEYTLALCIDD